MLISKFHKLVHDKLFWAVITVLICIAFVGLYLPGEKGGGSSRTKQVAGKLYGKKVLYPDFAKARGDAYLALSLSMGRQLQLTDSTRELLDRTAWARLATLKKAARLNITTSDAEMVRTVRSLPFFLNQQGQFDARMYDYFTANVLPSFGYTKRQFEEVYRDEATLQKVAFLPMQSALVTPDELKEAFHRLNDTFVLQYAELSEDMVAESVSVGDEDIAHFYNENRTLFATPEKVRIKYAAFPVADYLAEVSVSDTEAQAYYDQNLSQYVTKAATTNAPAEYTPFETVKAEVIEQVKTIGARRKALEAATEMVINLTPARDGTKTPSFEEAAEAMNATVKFAPDFAENETPETIDAGSEFARTAFTLEDTPTNYYSDAIVGQDYVYVIGLVRRLPSIIPDLEAVKAEAEMLARQQATRTALHAKATELRATAQADFKTALSATGATVKTTPEFSLSSGLEENPNGPALSRAAISLEEGGISEPLAAQNGNLILAQLTERNPADEAEMELLRESLVAAVQNQRLQTIMASWQDSILTEAAFVDLTPKGE